MGVGAQGQEMHEVMQINLPIPLGVGVQRQVHAGQFARQTRLMRIDRLAVCIFIQKIDIGCIAAFGVMAQQGQDFLRLLGIEAGTSSLTVGRRLRRQMLRCRQIEFLIHDRVSRGILVHIGRAMANPLPRDEDRQLHMQLDLAHLERSRMSMAHQIIDQPAIFGNFLGATAVGNPGRLNDRTVVAHIVDHAEKSVIQHRNRCVHQRLEGSRGGAKGWTRSRAGLSDFGFLFGRQVHSVPIAHPPLSRNAPSPYIGNVGSPTMAINAARNKRYGPGGGTRRLHHLCSPALAEGGKPTGAKQARHAQ